MSEPDIRACFTAPDAAVRFANSMTKQMISFTDPQRAWLKRKAERLGISIAELVRRIIDADIQRDK